MITWMQKHRKYLVVTIWIATIAFIGAGFVGWGAYSYGGNKSSSIAKVGDKEITVDEIQNKYSNLYNYYNQMMGGKLTKEKAKELKLEDIAMQQLTKEALLLNYAKELGLKALDSEVIEEYKSIKAFQVDDVFNKKRYERVLANMGTSKNSFENELKKNVLLKKLFTVLKLPTTTLENESVFASLSLEDKVEIKIIKADENITIDEKELKSFWEKNKGDYKSQTSYTIDAINVKAETFDVTDAEIEEFYNEKKFLFKNQEGKIKPLSDAKEDVKKEVQFKKAKSAILKKYLALKNGKIKADKRVIADMRYAMENNIPGVEFRDAKAGKYLKALKTRDGYMTAKVISVNKPKELEFEKAKDAVEATYKRETIANDLKTKAQNAQKEFKDGIDIGFVSQTTPTEIKDLNQMEANQLMKTIFSSKNKSGYVMLNNKAVVYKIVDQKLFNKEKFEKEKEKFTKTLENIKTSSVEEGLIKQLTKKYKIERY